jgi:serine/threonine-protein kinase
MYEFVRRDPSGAVERVGFPSGSFVMGSDLGADLQVERLAPHHAEFSVDGTGRIWVRDLSGGGTTVDGRRVTDDEEVPLGATVRLGPLELEVRAVDTRSSQFPAPSFANTAVSSGKLKNQAALTASLAPDVVVGGAYRVVGLLARGGMGEVYEAEQLDSKRVVALKVMLGTLSSDPQFASRFQAEALATKRIDHQHVIEVLEFGQTDDGRPFFAMEFLEGRTLSDLIAREAPLPVTRVAAIGVQVGQALAAAHREGIVHRDLKPDNVMLIDREGEPDFVKVVDFGVAKMNQATSNTAVGALIGTPLYMSPEQARGQPVDQRADIYSLGLMLHEMLTGEPCFPANNPFKVLERQIRDPAPPLPEAVPSPLRELIAQMLQKSETDRVRSVALVVAALEPLRTPPRRVAWWPWALALVGVVVATAMSVHTTVPVAPVSLGATPVRLPPAPIPVEQPREPARTAVVETVTKPTSTRSKPLIFPGPPRAAAPRTVVADPDLAPSAAEPVTMAPEGATTDREEESPPGEIPVPRSLRLVLPPSRSDPLQLIELRVKEERGMSAEGAHDITVGDPSVVELQIRRSPSGPIVLQLKGRKKGNTLLNFKLDDGGESFRQVRVK